MAKDGSPLYFLLKDSSGVAHKITGRLVEAGEGSAVVAVATADVPEGVQQTLSVPAASNQPGLSFVRIPASSYSTVVPVGWSRSSQLPKAALCVAAWKTVGQKALESSEAEKPTSAVEARAKAEKGKMEADLEQLMRVMKETGDDPDSEGSSEDEPPLTRPKSRRSMLAPGGKSSSSKEKPKERDPDPQETMLALMEQGMSQGQSPAELMPYMMMSLMMQQQQSKKRGHRSRRKSRSSSSSSRGGSSLDEGSSDGGVDNKGMKAVVTLHRLHRRIKKRPKEICRTFEKEITEELGIVEGQPWTLKQWLAKQPWGKFRGIYRCAIQDAVAYEYLRNGQHDIAAAQLAQNMKSKIQSVIQQGDWSAAWLLTGINDPLSRKEWGGTKGEMAIVSEYMNSLAKLRKRVKEAKESNAHEDAEEDQHRQK